MQQRPTHATVDLGAIRTNAALLAECVAPARLLAVVKADGYGHGSVAVARAALEGGASWLGVALVEEGRALRAAGISAPILLFSEPPVEAAAEVVQLDLIPAVYTEPGIHALAAAATEAGTVLSVHLKVDTGMRRVGAEPAQVLGFARMILADPALTLGGVMTHFAVADEPGTGVDVQRERFDHVLAELVADGIDPGVRHAANSAALLTRPETRYDMVRAGIALYGLPPVSTDLELLPALSLVSAVSFVKRVHADEAVSYGWRYRTQHETSIATVPIGYADGVRRALHAVGGEVLIRGQRFPIAGTITMDQLMVDVGNVEVQVGDTVTLIGTDGAASVSAEEWASALGTIAYEVVCSFSPRVPRIYGGTEQ